MGEAVFLPRGSQSSATGPGQRAQLGVGMSAGHLCPAPPVGMHEPPGHPRPAERHVSVRVTVAAARFIV